MSMTNRRITLVLAAALLWPLAGMLAAQAPTPQQGKPGGAPAGQQNPPAAGQQEQPAAPKLNPEEEAEYKKFLQTKPDDAQALVKAGEEFLKKFPESRYRESIYSRLTGAYMRLGDENKMVESGEKALQLNPDDVDVLPLMAMALPRRFDPNDISSEQLLVRAQNYAQHAIELLQKLPKPASLTDEQFTRARNEKLAMCHSGLGLVSYYQNNVPRMASELEQALQLEAEPDAVDEFLLGFAYTRLGRYSDAVTQLERCSAQQTPMQQRCKTLLEQVKKLAQQQPATPKQP
jgi:tetratricopeptide (TPR) repeat protein